MADGEWQGNITLTLVIIALVICFAWIPVVAVISLFHNGRVRIRRFFERRGWMRPAPDEEKRVAQQQKAPWVQRPPPTYPNSSSRALERAVSTRTHNSAASWDPIRRWETASSNDPQATRASPGRSSPGRSNFSRPMPSRASSVRSMASNHQPSGQSRGRRPSNPGTAADLPPVTFQINDAYYDTTPLPDRPPSSGAAYIKPSASRSQSRASRSHSQASARSGSQSRKATSFDTPRQEPGRDPDDPFWQRPGTSNSQLPPSFSPPPRRASLSTQAFERPAWLDQPHAM